MYHVPTIFFLTYFGIFDAVGFWGFLVWHFDAIFGKNLIWVTLDDYKL